MDEKELRALEDPEEWDSDSAEVLPPSKSARAVVSVAFARDDFDRVAEAAERENMRTSEFIRESALARAAQQHHRRSRILAISGWGNVMGVGSDITTTRRGASRLRWEHFQSPQIITARSY